jgi:hypothetical protein
VLADVVLFQRESSDLRSKMGGSLPATQAAAMQTELETAQSSLLQLQQHVQKLEADQSYKQAAMKFTAAERSVLLAKISDTEQDRFRIEKQLQLCYAHRLASSEDSFKAIISDKDAEIDRLKSALMREQADTTLRIQTVQQAEVRPNPYDPPERKSSARRLSTRYV